VTRAQQGDADAIERLLKARQALHANSFRIASLRPLRLEQRWFAKSIQRTSGRLDATGILRDSRQVA